MDRRVVVVGLFVGVAAALVAALLLGAQPSRGPRQARPERPVTLSPEALRRVDVRHASRFDRSKLQAVRPRDESDRANGVDATFTLDQQGIVDAVATRKEDLRGCWETARVHVPSLANVLVVQFALQMPPGDSASYVISARVESTEDLTGFDACVRTALEDLRFEGGEPVTVRYPVTFAPPRAP